MLISHPPEWELKYIYRIRGNQRDTWIFKRKNNLTWLLLIRNFMIFKGRKCQKPIINSYGMEIHTSILQITPFSNWKPKNQHWDDHAIIKNMAEIYEYKWESFLISHSKSKRVQKVAAVVWWSFQIPPCNSSYTSIIT